MELEKDMIYHPAHYNIDKRKECWDEFVDDYGVDNTIVWCLMTAKKYLYRMGLKRNNPFEQDLDKARNYYNHACFLSDKYDVSLPMMFSDIEEELHNYDNN